MPPLNQIEEQKRVQSAHIGSNENLLQVSETQLTDYLRQINLIGLPTERNPSTLEIYTWFVAKEKAIYTALNTLKVRDERDTTYTGFTWAPLQMENQIKEALTLFPTVEFNVWRSTSAEPVHLTPPTYYKVSEI